MNATEYLIKNYKHKVTPGIKTTENLIEYLMEKVDITPISSAVFPELFLQSVVRDNALNGFRNQRVGLSENQLEFTYYQLVRNAKSEKYFKKYYGKEYVDYVKDEFIHIIFEKRLGMISCNCGRLFLDLLLRQGVDQFDFENETMALINYLLNLEIYINEGYSSL